MLVICDKCNKALIGKDIVLCNDEVSNEDGLVLRTIYYMTPCCNNKNIIAYENSKCDELRIEIKKARNLNDNKRLQDIVRDLSKEMNTLRREHGVK